MANRKDLEAGGDDVLSLGSSDEFSGFDMEDIGLNAACNVASCSTSSKKPRVKSVVFAKGKENSPKSGKKKCLSKSSSSKKTTKTSRTTKRPASSKSQSNSVADVSSGATQSQPSPAIDFSNMSMGDINNLRQVLGIQGSMEQPSSGYENFGPNLHIEVDSADISDDGQAGHANVDFSNEFSSTLFDNDSNEDWDLPKLKEPSKGKPIAGSLATLINTACTSQCDIEPMVDKHSIPENCDKMAAPSVNPEVWKVLYKRTQVQDKCFQEIQNLLATSMVPIIKLADVLKPHIQGNAESKTLLSEALTLIGQAQHGLSLRRRYMIRPNLKNKYTNLCNINVPISAQLFGDDVNKQIKQLDTTAFIGREQRYNAPFYRGRGFSRPPRRGGYNYRYQPYPQQRGGFHRQPFQSFRGRGRRPAATATVTSPNGQ